MTDDRPYFAENRAELERLRALAGSLSEAELNTAAPGWSVATTLAHLAFWDRAAVTCLGVWRSLPAGALSERLAERAGWITEATITPFRQAGISEEEAATLSAEAMNDRLAGGWSRIPAKQAVADALAAAEELAARIAGLDAEMADLIQSSRFAWLLTPSGHWQEHIDEIEAGLAATCGGQAR
jgi:hypothetical protein